MNADPAQTHVAVQWKHDSPFITCRFDPTGRFVFASAEDHTVQRWELGSETKAALAGHESWVRGIAFSPDGETLFTGGYDGRLVWWPAAAEQPEPLRSVDAHDGWVRSVSVSPDGALVATAGNDRLVKLWNAADGSLVREMAAHECHVYSTLWHPGGEFLLSGDLHGKVKQWAAATGELVREFEAGDLHSYNAGQRVDYGGVRSLTLSPDGRLLASNGLHKATNPLGAVNEPLVVLFDWETGEKVIAQTAEGVRGVAWRAIWHPDGFLVACSGGSGGGFFLFWKPDKEGEFFKFKLPDTARDLDLHPDGVQLATAHYDRHVRISRMAAKAG